MFVCLRVDSGEGRKHKRSRHSGSVTSRSSVASGDHRLPPDDDSALAQLVSNNLQVTRTFADERMLEANVTAHSLKVCTNALHI